MLNLVKLKLRDLAFFDCPSKVKFYIDVDGIQTEYKGEYHVHISNKARFKDLFNVNLSVRPTKVVDTRLIQTGSETLELCIKAM